MLPFVLCINCITPRHPDNSGACVSLCRRCSVLIKLTGLSILILLSITLRAVQMSVWSSVETQFRLSLSSVINYNYKSVLGRIKRHWAKWSASQVTPCGQLWTWSLKLSFVCVPRIAANKKSNWADVIKHYIIRCSSLFAHVIAQSVPTHSDCLFLLG